MKGGIYIDSNRTEEWKLSVVNEERGESIEEVTLENIGTGAGYGTDAD